MKELFIILGFLTLIFVETWLQDNWYFVCKRKRPVCRNWACRKFVHCEYSEKTRSASSDHDR